LLPLVTHIVAIQLDRDDASWHDRPPYVVAASRGAAA
jgi:hypothetical protein